MLDGKYKNLKVDSTFSDALKGIHEGEQIDLTPELVDRAKLLSESISEPTYVDSPSRDILSAFRDTAPQDLRYNQNLFKRFEEEVYGK